MDNFGKKILYYTVYCIWFLFSLLPFWILYLISDGLYYVIYYLVGYRRAIVKKNLAASFPEKSAKELVEIEKKFYSWFCDYFVESVKLMSMSEKQIRKRMRFEHLDVLNESFANGKSVALYLGHYCNWEWVTSFPLAIDSSVVSGQIYHELENKVFDKLFLRLRGRFGALSISMQETLRKIMGLHQDNKQIIIGFIADQTPLWHNIHYWLDFLNHDTPVFTGTEKIARRVGMDIFYLDMRREKRGYYVGEFKFLSKAPYESEEFGVTRLYFSELEKTIQRQPQYWLWTHNRWKRTHEEFCKRFPNAKMKK